MIVSHPETPPSLCGSVLTAGRISKCWSGWASQSESSLIKPECSQSTGEAMRPQQVTGIEAPIRDDLPTDFWRRREQHTAGVALNLNTQDPPTLPAVPPACGGLIDCWPLSAAWWGRGRRSNKVGLSSDFTDDISHHGAVAVRGASLCLSPAAKKRAEVEYAVKSYLIRILNLGG